MAASIFMAPAFESGCDVLHTSSLYSGRNTATGRGLGAERPGYDRSGQKSSSSHTNSSSPKKRLQWLGLLKTGSQAADTLIYMQNDPLMRIWPPAWGACPLFPLIAALPCAVIVARAMPFSEIRSTEMRCINSRIYSLAYSRLRLRFLIGAL
jgi:hypothetical protein